MPSGSQPVSQPVAQQPRTTKGANNNKGCQRSHLIHAAIKISKIQLKCLVIYLAVSERNFPSPISRSLSHSLHFLLWHTRHFLHIIVTCYLSVSVSSSVHLFRSRCLTSFRSSIVTWSGCLAMSVIRLIRAQTTSWHATPPPTHCSNTSRSLSVILALVLFPFGLDEMINDEKCCKRFKMIQEQSQHQISCQLPPTLPTHPIL